jgi:hypothetical protein
LHDPVMVQLAEKFLCSHLLTSSRSHRHHR